MHKRIDYALKNGLALSLLFGFLLTTAYAQPGSNSTTSKGTKKPRRFFSDASFWNTPIPANPAIDARSAEWIALMKREPNHTGLGINATRYTIPVYEVDSTTPRYTVHEMPLSHKQPTEWLNAATRNGSVAFHHGRGFGAGVPIPDKAAPDARADAHLALVDWQQLRAWDMWQAKKDSTGTWYANTGMTYRLDGPGVFKTSDFPIRNGESIHFYGPGRASGVPIIAGLIMYDEVLAGEIRHKIAAASRFVAYQEFVFPAAWTDGPYPGGIPEGATLQLDPALDLSQFDLTPAEKAIAKALQTYGMVLVDYGGANVIYAEGLYGKPDQSWTGVLREFSGGLTTIPLDHYRVLRLGPVTRKGDQKWKVKPGDIPKI